MVGCGRHGQPDARSLPGSTALAGARGRAGWEASIDAAPALPLTVDSDPLNALKPDLWAALFHDTTQVKPFRFEDYRGLPVETFPIWSIYDTIANVYGRASSDPAYGGGSNRPGLGVLAGDPDLGAIARPSFPEPDPTWNPQQTSPVPFPDAPPVIEKPEPQEPSHREARLCVVPMAVSAAVLAEAAAGSRRMRRTGRAGAGLARSSAVVVRRRRRSRQTLRRLGPPRCLRRARRFSRRR